MSIALKIAVVRRLIKEFGLSVGRTGYECRFYLVRSVVQTRWGYDCALFIIVAAVAVAGIIYGSLNYNKLISPRVS